MRAAFRQLPPAMPPHKRPRTENDQAAARRQPPAPRHPRGAAAPTGAVVGAGGRRRLLRLQAGIGWRRAQGRPTAARRRNRQRQRSAAARTASAGGAAHPQCYRLSTGQLFLH